MISFNFIWLVVLISGIISFTLMIFFNAFNAKKHDPNFSFRNYFPYEYFNKLSKIFAFIFVISLFASLSTILPYSVDLGNNFILLIVITFVIGLSGVTSFVNMSLPLKYMKEHMIVSTIQMASSFLSIALATVRLFLAYSIESRFNQGTLYLCFGVLGAILSILMLVVIFNPKLKDWTKLDVINVNGEKTYSRPKFVSLAYSEWISLLILLFSQILFLISMIG